METKLKREVNKNNIKIKIKKWTFEENLNQLK